MTILDIWLKISELLINEEYDVENLKFILRRWCEILGYNYYICDSRSELIRTLSSVLRVLKQKSEDDRKDIIFEIIPYLLDERVLSIEKLNMIFAEINFPYRYEVSNGESLYGGIFLKSEENVFMKRKYDKIFISHSYKDKEICDELVFLLEDIGLTKNEIFYSSLPGFGVPLGKNIADTIKMEFTEKRILVIFMLSTNYYESVKCLNEMGAAWVKQTDFQTFLLPGFEARIDDGAIDASVAGIILDNRRIELWQRLKEFVSYITDSFMLSVDTEKIDRKLNLFIEKIEGII